MKFVFSLLVIQLVCVWSGRVSYENFKTYRIEPRTEGHLKVLRSYENNAHVDYWVEVTTLNKLVVVMVDPKFSKIFEEDLSKNNIQFAISIENVEEVLKQERINRIRKPSVKKGEVAFDRYLRYSEIQDYLARLAVDHKDLVKVENYGLSYEKRNLTSIKITTGGNDQKPLIFVDAGIHAREWLGPAQALYIIDQLLDNPENKQLLNNIDWVVIPLLNPDGYEYTHTVDRLWRKTRSKGTVCDGVDPNRNFDFHWSEQGGSSDECSTTYAGPKPFSEPETLALSKVISKYENRAKLYLTFHTPLQCMLFPYGYTSELPENYEELLSLGNNVADSIYAVNQTRYKVGTSVQINSYAAGSSRDWAYGVAKINLSYTVELPLFPESPHEMPPENILGVVTEMFEGVKTFYDYIEQKYVFV